MATSFSFNKQEKLKSRKLTEQLFAEGKTFSVYPIKLWFMEIKDENDFPLKIGVTVSSKKFKHAVDRNRIKRLLRETYRLNKTQLHEFVQKENKQLAVFFLYLDKELPEFNNLQTKMQKAIGKLIAALSENNS
jgi:ribonuclease P protein component